MRDQEELAILTGLLDFYSDRATAHASFVVAGVFGMYTVMFGNSILPRWVFFFVYLALLLIDVYSFMNFGYYAQLAYIIRIKLEGEHKEEYRKEIISKFKEGNRMFYVFGQIKQSILSGKKRFWFFFVLWVIAIILPFVWILLQPI